MAAYRREIFQIYVKSFNIIKLILLLDLKKICEISTRSVQAIFDTTSREPHHTANRCVVNFGDSISFGKIRSFFGISAIWKLPCKKLNLPLHFRIIRMCFKTIKRMKKSLLLLMTLFASLTAWAGDVDLTEDKNEAEGTAARWFVTVPAGTEENHLTLSDASIIGRISSGLFHLITSILSYQ